MEQLKMWVDENINKFSQLDESEIVELNPDYLDDNIVKELKTKHNMHKPFLHNGIAVYYYDDLVCVENMNVEEEE